MAYKIKLEFKAENKSDIFNTLELLRDTLEEDKENFANWKKIETKTKNINGIIDFNMVIDETCSECFGKGFIDVGVDDSKKCPSCNIKHYDED